MIVFGTAFLAALVAVRVLGGRALLDGES
jgi:hypothetical protein